MTTSGNRSAAEVIGLFSIFLTCLFITTLPFIYGQYNFFEIALIPAAILIGGLMSYKLSEDKFLPEVALEMGLLGLMLFTLLMIISWRSIFS